jgi:hypothetical protein
LPSLFVNQNNIPIIIDSDFWIFRTDLLCFAAQLLDNNRFNFRAPDIGGGIFRGFQRAKAF